METADEPFRLLSVHAHPDDESSKGAGTVALLSDSGVRCVLVCCTGGEAGDILNPAMDREDVKANLPAVRREELARAAEIIGYDEVIDLGYRDSGMPDTDANAHPEAFANADHHVPAAGPPLHVPSLAPGVFTQRRASRAVPSETIGPSCDASSAG